MNRYNKGMTKKEFKEGYSNYRNHMRVLTISIMNLQHLPIYKIYWDYMRETSLRKKSFFERIYNKKPKNNNFKHCMPRKLDKLHQKGVEILLTTDQVWEYKYNTKFGVYDLEYIHVIKIKIMPETFKKMFIKKENR